MESLKLTSILKTLNKTEIEKFSMFLNSPLFNERETLSNFYEAIKTYYPDFKNSLYTKENIFKRLYKNKPYSDELMRNMISRLYKQLENFLSFINFEKDGFRRQYGLLMELNDRGHEKLFRKKIAEVRKLSGSEKCINTDTFYREHLLAFLARHHYDTFKHTHIIENDSLQQRETKLTEYFLVDILKIYCLMINQVNLYPERKYNLGMLEYVLNYIEKNQEYFSDNFLLQIYYNMLLMHKEKKEVYFLNMKSLLNKHSAKLSRPQKTSFYSALHNYIQDDIFSGNSKAVHQKFDLYKESFANEGVYWEEGVINHIDIIGAVNYSLIAKDFSLAHEFLEKYLHEVDEYYRESSGNYCLALIDYYRSDYNSVLSRLAKVNYDDVSYKIQVKTLSLMTYFSMNETESFYSFVDSFRHFLYENKQVSDYFKNLYINFINFALKLFKGKEDLEKFDVESYKQELTGTKNVAKKHWLLEQSELIEIK